MQKYIDVACIVVLRYSAGTRSFQTENAAISPLTVVLNVVHGPKATGCDVLLIIGGKIP